MKKNKIFMLTMSIEMSGRKSDANKVKQLMEMAGSNINATFNIFKSEGSMIAPQVELIKGAKL